MNEEEMRYRVTAVVSTTMQIVVQARSEQEAEAFSDAIDFEKWQVVSSEYETVDVAKDYFVRKQKIEQDISRTSDAARSHLLKIVKS